MAGKPEKLTEARITAFCKAATLDDADASGRATLRDGGCRGLQIVVNVDSGSARYYFVGRVDGRSVRRALGDVQHTRLAEAREAVHRLQHDRSVAGTLAPRPAAATEAEPIDNSPLLGPVVDDMLTAHATGRWLPGNRSKTPCDRTVKFYSDVRRAQLAKHEHLTLLAFAEALPTVYGDLKAKAPYQANRFLQLCRNIYAYAETAGLWEGVNPAIGSGAKRLTRSPEQVRTRTLTDAEWQRLAEALEADLPIWRTAFTLSLLTLQRMGAVLAMRWCDLTLAGDDAAWRIPAPFMKGRKAGHTVPLADTPEALSILKTWRALVPDGCEWVFPTADDCSRHIEAYDKAWRRVITRAGIWHADKDIRPRPHDLRRTGGERMTSAGVPLQTVTRALGDAPSSAPMVAKVYAVVADDALRAAFAASSKRHRK